MSDNISVGLPSNINVSIFSNLLWIEKNCQKIDFTCQIIDMFQQSAKALLTLINNDINTWAISEATHHALHQLKTSSSMLGLIDTTTNCQSLDQLCTTKSSITLVIDQLKCLNDAYIRDIQTLNNIIPIIPELLQQLP